MNRGQKKSQRLLEALEVGPLLLARRSARIGSRAIAGLLCVRFASGTKTCTGDGLWTRVGVAALVRSSAPVPVRCAPCREGVCPVSQK